MFIGWLTLRGEQAGYYVIVRLYQVVFDMELQLSREHRMKGIGYRLSRVFLYQN